MLLFWCIPLAHALMPDRQLFAGSLSDAGAEEFFETTIRPLLAENCWNCHGSESQWSGLRLDSLQAMRAGGDSGPAVVAGAPDDSLIVQAIEGTGGLQMPPNSPLSQAQINALRSWIEQGAHWPEGGYEPAVLDGHVWKEHWAFQPIHSRPPPASSSNLWGNNPVDSFVMQKLEEHGLKPSAQADRRTLIRRVTYGLTGLPPTAEEIQAFVDDPDPGAYDRLVDRLLASPRHGEHLARLWMDVARFSDTKGYVYAREERFFVNSAAYRHWLIDACNQDLPYDQMIRLQIAADEFGQDQPQSLAAMGFLTLGRRFLGVTHDIIDDRIDVVSRAVMGLTVSCARCHDHKYDPIPTADYYSLYGVFRGSTQKQIDWYGSIEAEANGDSPSENGFLAELRTRIQRLNTTMTAKRTEAAQRVRERLADYLFAQSQLDRYHQEGFDVILSPDDLIPAFVRRWEEILSATELENDIVFGPWFLFLDLKSDSFEAQASDIAEIIVGNSTYHPWVVDLFRQPPQDLRSVADRYAELFQRIDRQHSASDEQDPVWLAAARPLLSVLYGPGSPCEVPDEEMVSVEMFFDSATCDELWRLQGEVDRWLLKAEDIPAVAVTLVDRDHFLEPRIFRRGNPARKGPRVPRKFLTFLSETDHAAFTRGSGRAELAQRLVDPSNPLTARVWVNRLWQQLFGEGLVRTPSDFGLRSEHPSHPELLDWLANQLMELNWSSKSLQKMMVMSAAYQQESWESSTDDEEKLTAAGESVLGQQVDPENRLLWRASSRRLSFEELRDSMLEASNHLHLVASTKPQPLFDGSDNNFQRTVFGLIDRQFLPATLRIFDFANPDLHVGRRNQTLVPQQALFLLNHPFVAMRARSLVTGLEIDDSPDSKRSVEAVEKIYRAVLKREPSAHEVQWATSFLASTANEAHEPVAKETLAWSYGYGQMDEDRQRIVGFSNLPHFTGSAWQGGSSYPDSSLGWVQLSATGGHPGNDLQHACIRRWTAPEAMIVYIESLARHEPEVSDGIRCWIVSSRQGILEQANLHGGQQAINCKAISVEAGETIDFMVDIGSELNSDQFLWAPVIREVPPTADQLAISAYEDRETGNDQSASRMWDAMRDFRGPTAANLSPLEQLAQALLLTNEFAFVD
jgi:hypothetical protein